MAEDSDILRSRLSRELTDRARYFVSSMKEDMRTAEEDIYCTLAHDKMLFKQGIISKEQLDKITDGLLEALTKLREGTIQAIGKYEDIHPLVEAYVISKHGREIGGRIHTGRSRNDQVMCDVRMKLRREILDIRRVLHHLMSVMISRAENELETVMPAYTHTQHAQITTLAHWLLAYVDAFMRDEERLVQSYRRVNMNPLGACAVAGTSIPIDRAETTRLLGFQSIIENSMDAVSSRDFVLELAANLAIIANNISRIAEELILWSSSEFGFAELPDELASPSSVMPQKKNPEVLELMRGRSGIPLAVFSSLFVMTKGLISGYSQDLQETKPHLWQSLDSVVTSLDMLQEVIAKIEFDRGRMKNAATEGYIAALDLAELLTVETGIPFRVAHEIVAKLVKGLVDRGVPLKEARQKDLAKIFSTATGKRLTASFDFKEICDPVASVKRRKSGGSPSPAHILQMLSSRKSTLNQIGQDRELEEKRLDKIESELLPV